MIKVSEHKFNGFAYQYHFNNDSNETLLFLHGFTGNSSVWDDYVEQLKNEFNILLVDLAGHGNSDSPKNIDEYLLSNQASNISKILNELEIKSFSIISYSYSCYIAILVAEKMKEKTKYVVLISPYFKEKFSYYEKWLLNSTKLIWRFLIPNKKYKLDYSKLKDYENPNFYDTKYTLRCINTKDILGSMYSFLNHEGIPEFDNIKTPLLIIYGENDKTLSNKAKDVQIKGKNLKVQIIKGKKHIFLKTEYMNLVKSIQTFIINK